MSLEKIWKKYEPHASLKSILFQYLQYALNVMNLWIYWLKKEWSKQVFVNQVHWLYLKSHAPNLVVSNILTLIMIRSFTSHCLKVVLISWYKNYMISPKVSIIMFHAARKPIGQKYKKWNNFWKLLLVFMMGLILLKKMINRIRKHDSEIKNIMIICLSTVVQLNDRLKFKLYG